MSHELSLQVIGDEVHDRLKGVAPVVGGAINIYAIVRAVVDVLADHEFLDIVEVDK